MNTLRSACLISLGLHGIALSMAAPNFLSAHAQVPVSASARASRALHASLQHTALTPSHLPVPSATDSHSLPMRTTRQPIRTRTTHVNPRRTPTIPVTVASLDTVHNSPQTLRAEHADTARATAMPITQEMRDTVVLAQPNYAQNPEPDYPMLLREQGIGGVVWLRVRVGVDGSPSDIQLFRGSGYRLFDEAALRAVRHWQFSPARRGQAAYAAWVEFPVRFALRD